MEHTQKKEIISKYARSKGDTGSPEVQIALLSVRIDSLSAHLAEHKKDNHSRRGLLGLVQKRRKLKNYLQRSNPEAFKKVTEEIENTKAANVSTKEVKSSSKKITVEKSAEKGEKKVSAKSAKSAAVKKAKK